MYTTSTYFGCVSKHLLPRVGLYSSFPVQAMEEQISRAGNFRQDLPYLHVPLLGSYSISPTQIRGPSKPTLKVTTTARFLSLDVMPDEQIMYRLCQGPGNAGTECEPLF